MEDIRAENPGMTKACLEVVRRTGFPPLDDMPRCYGMLPAKRWAGLWNSGWEWTNFCPAPARECPIASEHGDVWLEFADKAYDGPDLPDGIYEIEFIGRRTAKAGSFGHLSQYDHAMVVDRVLSITLVQDGEVARK